ncbi:hypothetical protein QUQ58_004008 [Escherichia coli]|nr:hypothetical protein [Escherichia coli]
MNILKLEGFRQIPESKELCSSYNSGNIISALNAYGVTMIDDVKAEVSSIRRDTQTVNTVERTGLLLTAASNVSFVCPLPDVKKTAVQMGFRLTLGEGKKYSSSPSYIRIGNYSFTTPYPDEAASYYYEIFATRSENGYVSASLYCNRSLVGSASLYVSDDRTDKIGVNIGGGTIFSSGVTGTLMLGDMYCGTIPYGSGNSAEPALLGSIEVRYSPVTAFTGGSAKNSLDKDIVTGLNTADSEAGYLMLFPSLNAAQVTFGAVDNSNSDVVAVMASVTYRGADAPNNCLAWKVKNGSNEGTTITENGAQNDTNRWTTVSQSFMTLPGGEESFTKGELVFVAELNNTKRET